MSFNAATVNIERLERSNSEESFELETDDITEFSVVYGDGYPGSTVGFSAPSGKLVISNLRIVFLPIPPLTQFTSFSCVPNNILKISLESSSLFSLCKTVMAAKIELDPSQTSNVSAETIGDLRIKFKSKSTAQLVKQIVLKQQQSSQGK